MCRVRLKAEEKEARRWKLEVGAVKPSEVEEDLR